MRFCDERKLKSGLVTDRWTVLAALTGVLLEQSKKGSVVEIVEARSARSLAADDWDESRRGIARGDARD